MNEIIHTRTGPKNIYQALRSYLVDSGWTSIVDNERTALVHLACAYESLAPDWNNAPDDVRWYTIDADGTCYWHENEATEGLGCWESGAAEYAGIVILTYGIDWRLCKWQRPEAAQ